MQYTYLQHCLDSYVRLARELFVQVHDIMYPKSVDQSCTVDFCMQHLGRTQEMANWQRSYSRHEFDSHPDCIVVEHFIYQ